MMYLSYILCIIFMCVRVHMCMSVCVIKCKVKIVFFTIQEFHTLKLYQYMHDSHKLLSFVQILMLFQT